LQLAVLCADLHLFSQPKFPRPLNGGCSRLAPHVSRIAWMRKAAMCNCADWGRLVREKKYTEDHEWIELSQDGKTGE
jgi:hypothetical protein